MNNQLGVELCLYSLGTRSVHLTPWDVMANMRRGAYAEAIWQGFLKRVADRAIQKWFSKRCSPARNASQAASVKTIRLYQGRHRQDLAQESSNQWWCHRKLAIVLLPLALSLSVLLCGFYNRRVKLVFVSRPLNGMSHRVN